VVESDVAAAVDLPKAGDAGANAEPRCQSSLKPRNRRGSVDEARPTISLSTR
jgi:hypothetical protein